MTESSEKTMIEHHDLSDDPRKRHARPPTPRLIFVALETRMNLARGLSQKEQAPRDQDHVAARDLAAQHADEGGRQPHDPSNRQKQQDPRQHRDRETDKSRTFLLRQRQTTQPESR